MTLPYVILPAGLHPASVALVDPGSQAPVAPVAILADNIDPATGEIASLTTRVHPVDAAFAEAFRVRKDSGAATGAVGQKLYAIAMKGDSLEREIRDEINRIAKPFVDRRDIDITAVIVDTDDARQGFDGAGALIKYTNRLTAKPEELRV